MGTNVKRAVSVVAIACLLLAMAAGAEQAAHADMPVALVSPGIYRGPTPQTSADYRQLHALGVRTVLDLRRFRRKQRDQECACLRAYGIDYVNVPVAFYPERDGSAERALRTLSDAERHPIYIHCEYGRDRSGLVIALYRVRCEGWRPQSAYCEMLRFGFNTRLRGLERYFWEQSR